MSEPAPAGILSTMKYEGLYSRWEVKLGIQRIKKWPDTVKIYKSKRQTMLFGESCKYMIAEGYHWSVIGLVAMREM